jgi:transposase
LRLNKNSLYEEIASALLEGISENWRRLLLMDSIPLLQQTMRQSRRDKRLRTLRPPSKRAAKVLTGVSPLLSTGQDRHSDDGLR